MKSAAPFISKEIFLEVLQDDNFLTKDTLRIFQILYNSPGQELTTTDIANTLGWKSVMSVNTRIVTLGKRMEKYYGILPRQREDGSKSYWDFFFTGYYVKQYFLFKFKPELKKALEECCLVDSRIRVIQKWNTDEADFSDLR